MNQTESELKNLDELIELYVLRCDVEGKSPRTVLAYRETLARFLRIAREEGFPMGAPAIRPEHLYTYLGRYSQHSYETRHRYFREVRCFFNWLQTMGYIVENPFRSLKNVRLPQRIVQPFSADDSARLLAACDTDVPVGTRNHAILLTLLDTGIRCSELVQLTIDDLDLEDGRLRILHAKGNKQRVVSFAGRCREALEQHLGFRGWGPGRYSLRPSSTVSSALALRCSRTA